MIRSGHGLYKTWLDYSLTKRCLLGLAVMREKDLERCFNCLFIHPLSSINFALKFAMKVTWCTCHMVCPT